MASLEVLRLDTDLVGASVPRLDTKLKVTGKAVYSRDLKLPRMLHARFKRSPFPHARILRINAAEAYKASGVRKILTGLDFPDISTEDTPPLAHGEVLYSNQRG
jgi:CO/xanthine dehydrogenase Mo-binding subunit